MADLKALADAVIKGDQATAVEVTKAALSEGHEVDVFFAGDGVDYIRAETRAAASGVGLGNAGEHWTDLVAGGANLWGSGMSASARGVHSAT